MKEAKRNLVAGTIGAAVLSAGAFTSSAMANPFGMDALESGYKQIAAEGKCGEGKCGADKMKDKAKAATEGKCGEGKCGADKMKDKVKEKAAEEGKCGEGKCGSM